MSLRFDRHPLGPLAKVSASRAANQRSNPALPAGLFPGRAMPVTSLSLGHRPGAGIMEADHRQVTTVFTVQPSFHHRHSTNHRLVGLVVRRPPRERKIPGSNPVCAGIFWGSSHTSDSKIGTPVATLSGAWRYRVSAGTGRPGVSIL